MSMILNFISFLHKSRNLKHISNVKKLKIIKHRLFMYSKSQNLTLSFSTKEDYLIIFALSSLQDYPLIYPTTSSPRPIVQSRNFLPFFTYKVEKHVIDISISFASLVFRVSLHRCIITQMKKRISNPLSLLWCYQLTSSYIVHVTSCYIYL